MDRPLSSSEKREYAKNYPRKNEKRKIRISYHLIVSLVLFFLLITVVAELNKTQVPLHLSRHESRGFAPDPSQYKDAVVQVYSARTWGAKGYFAVHTWLAFKEYGANSYQVSQVIGWRQERSGNVVFTEQAIADKTWWGNEPTLLLDLRGEAAQDVIPDIKAAIVAYPWANEYVVYPGPNSNTFISWIGQQVPQMNLDLPATAIGKDWRPLDQSFRESPSGTGLTASFFGLAGLQMGIEEGFELNILGLHLEADLLDLQLGLPLIGTVSIGWLLLFLVIRFVLFRLLKRYDLTYLKV